MGKLAGLHWKKDRGIAVWFVPIFLFAVAFSSFAQLPTATILGTVKDSTGAVVPYVNLTARNVDNGQARTAVSGGDGSYRFSALPVGNYEIRTEHSGFETQVRSGLTLTVGQEAVLNFSLAVGAVEQTVFVTADAPLVNTTSGSLGGLWRQLYAQPWREATDAQALVPTVDEWVDHVEHAIALAGPTHVAIGLDLTSARSSLKDFNSASYPRLVEALRKRNISAQVLGENWLRVLDAAKVP